LTAASYKAALVRSMGQRSGLEGDATKSARTMQTMLAALVALEAGCSVTIEVKDAGWAGYISAQITSLAGKARLPDGIWPRFSLTWLGQIDKPVIEADVYLVDHTAMTDEAV
jgi:hypothetical protein